MWIIANGQPPLWLFPRRTEHLESVVITKSLSTKHWPWTSIHCPNQTICLRPWREEVFTKLDLSQAYLQLRLDEKSATYVTINTHQGLYRCNRLPFGVASSPALFQKLMDTVLRGIPRVICYIDDILISSPDEVSHLKTLDTVLGCLEKHGFRLKLAKCQFLMPSVDYLGH